MTKKISSLEDLFLEEISDLLSAEKQLVKALPKMAKACESEELQEALQEHLEETKNQINRLENIFEDLGQKPKRVTCKAMKGLIEEGEDLIEETEDAALEAGIIGSAQRVEHYEISGYGTARAHARQLGYKNAEKLLNETLDEEKHADEILNDLAESFVNEEAAANA